MTDEYELGYEKTVTTEFYWHSHSRPRIAVDTPPHVHAHREGDDVEHSHPGLGEVCMLGRRAAS